jgi:hypothetical protein
MSLHSDDTGEAEPIPWRPSNFWQGSWHVSQSSSFPAQRRAKSSQDEDSSNMPPIMDINSQDQPSMNKRLSNPPSYSHRSRQFHILTNWQIGVFLGRISQFVTRGIPLRPRDLDALRSSFFTLCVHTLGVSKWPRTTWFKDRLNSFWHLILQLPEPTWNRSGFTFGYPKSNRNPI